MSVVINISLEEMTVVITKEKEMAGIGIGIIIEKGIEARIEDIDFEESVALFG